jgi:hypothetical protein
MSSLWEDYETGLRPQEIDSPRQFEIVRRKPAYRVRIDCYLDLRVTERDVGMVVQIVSNETYGSRKDDPVLIGLKSEGSSKQVSFDSPAWQRTQLRIDLSSSQELISQLHELIISDKLKTQVNFQLSAGLELISMTLCFKSDGGRLKTPHHLWWLRTLRQ